MFKRHDGANLPMHPQSSLRQGTRKRFRAHAGASTKIKLIFALLFSRAMLRIMGTYLVKPTINGEKTAVERRRVGTVIQHFMHMPGILSKHARHWELRGHSYFHEVAEALCQFYTDMCMLT
jgi:hypothetical protein